MTPKEFIKYCKTLAQGQEQLDYKEIVNQIISESKKVDFSDYLEIHYTIAAHIENNRDEIKFLINIQKEFGIGVLWDLSEELTEEFYHKYTGKDWDGDYWETLDSFLEKKLNN